MGELGVSCQLTDLEHASGATRGQAKERSKRDEVGNLAQRPEVTLEVGLLVRCPSQALGVPERVGEALHHAVLGLVDGAQLAGQIGMTFTDAFGPVGRNLFNQGDVHAHVQKGVGFAVGRVVVASDRGFLLEQAVVLRVLPDHVGNHLL